MKHINFLFTSVIIIWVFLWLFIFPWYAYDVSSFIDWKEYHLWLDLQWWVELDYKVDLTEVKNEKDYNIQREKNVIEWLKSIVDSRVENLKINDSVITTASYWWEQHIIVQIPMKWKDRQENEENIRRAKEAIWKVIKIEFKEQRTEVTKEDLTERTKIAEDFITEISGSDYGFFVTADKYRDKFENVKSWTLSWTLSSLKEELFVLNNDQVKKWMVNEILTGTWRSGLLFENWEITQQAWEKGLWMIDITDVFMWWDDWSEESIEFDYLFVSSKVSWWISAKDALWRVLNDKYFVNSAVRFNQNTFQPVVELVFNDEWAEIFWELTERLINEQIAIFVWWTLVTAPVVQTAIRDWKAIITGNYTPKEARKLSNDINTWVVPAPIYLTSERTIDAKLWINSLERLVVAWLIWFFIIAIFLIWIYRVWGLFASIALLIYIILILTIVRLLWIVLTLASIAWLILSIWMAIDANILIFERVRDELKSWMPIKKAVQIGFEKSWTAIWDSNVTWFFIAIILYVFWINMIKGFWLMLAIWTVVSLISAMWVSRVFVMFIAQFRKKL